MRRLEQPFFATLLRFSAALTGGGKYSAYRRVRDFPHRSPEEIRTAQWSALKRLLEHAYRSVPYYHSLFDSLGIRPEEVRSPDDYRQLPLLGKETIRENLDRLRATGDVGSRVIRGETGGSTGVPLPFFHDKVYQDLSNGIALRSYAWAGWRPGDRTIWIWGAPRETSTARSWSGRLKSFLQRTQMLDAFAMADRDMDEWIERFQSYRPRFVAGYATSLALFADRVRETHAKIPEIEAIFSTAEQLAPAKRRKIEEVFRAKVYDGYGSREVLSIASECAQGGMHVLSDSVYLETVEDETGSRLIVTPLRNFAMPMIRYDIEDYGHLIEHHCDCGIGFPLMEMEIGRVMDSFVFPGGRRIYGQFFILLMFDIPGVKRFQFRQIRESRIELRVVLSESCDETTRSKIEGVEDAIRKESDGTVEVHTEFVDEIPLSPSGKHRYMISEVS